MRRLVLLLTLVTLPFGAAAEPGPQLLRSIEMRLADYRLYPDMESLSTRQAGALHLTLSSPSDGYLRTRARLRAILRWDEEETDQ